MFRRSAAHRHIEEALDDDPRIALVAVRKLMDDELPWLERRAVRHAREHGYNWARVGRLLSRSRQAVRKRYGSIDGTREPIAMSPLDEIEQLDARVARLHADQRRRDELRELEESIESGAADIVPW